MSCSEFHEIFMMVFFGMKNSKSSKTSNKYWQIQITFIASVKINWCSRFRLIQDRINLLEKKKKKKKKDQIRQITTSEANHSVYLATTKNEDHEKVSISIRISIQKSLLSILHLTTCHWPIYFFVFRSSWARTSLFI